MPSKGVPVYEGEGASEDILVDQTYQLMLDTYPDLFITDGDKAFLRDQLRATLTSIATTRRAEQEEQKRIEAEEKEKEHQEALAKAGERLGRGQRVNPLGNNSLFADMGIDEKDVANSG